MAPIETHTVAIIGHSGVGKRSYTTRFVTSLYMDRYDPTLEDSYRRQVTIDDVACMVDVLDTRGSVEYSALRESYLRSSDAFLLAYSITNRSSFDQIESFWWAELLRTRSMREESRQTILTTKSITSSRPDTTSAPTAVSTVASAASWPVAVLIGCKSDCETQRAVSYEEGVALAQRLGCGFFETSANLNTNVESSMFELIRRLRREQMEMKARLEGGPKGKTKSYGTAPSAPTHQEQRHSGLKHMYDQIFKPREAC